MSRRILIIAGIVFCVSIWFILASREVPAGKVTAPPEAVGKRDLHSEPPQEQKVAAANPEDSPPIVSGTGKYVEWTHLTPASKRTEIVEINESLLTRNPVLKAGDTLQVVLFGNNPLDATISEVKIWGNGTVAVNGRLSDNPDSRFFLSYTDGRASMLIQDRTADATYKVEYAPALASYVALEVDSATSDILECGVDAFAQPLQSSQSYESGAVDPTFTIEEASLPDTVTLDLLVVYTPAARVWEGSVPNMQNSISLAVQLANDTHGNSDTRIQINLVHSEEVAYTEEDPEDINSPGKYLDELKIDDDGIIDSVHTLRDTHAADFVVFVVDTEETGGLASRPLSYDRDDLAFSIVRVKQLDDTYTMVHEIGHNMGMGHSAGQTSQPFTSGIYPYAAGWQWADATSSASVGFCTVMTYENFDSSGGDEYVRVAHFSNPDVQYNGNATGSAGAADGARVIRNGRFDYSGFRGPKVVPTNAVSLFPDTLDFEEYFGIWFQPDTDELDWKRDGDGTPTPSSGPSAPYAGDFYAFIETSNVNPGDEAHLITILDLTGFSGAEIDFAFHMYGATMGSLYLEASTDGGTIWSPMWSLSGDQGNLWHTQNLDLSAYDGQSVRLRFRGVRGSNFQSDMALDDIVISAAPGSVTFTTYVDTNYPLLSDKTATGDPDLDGVNNFLEYAFGMLLDTSDAESGPTSTYDDVADELSISFLRAQAGVRYVVESTSDLDFAGSATEEWDSDLSPPNIVPVGNLQTVDVSMPGAGKLFLQVEATE